MAINIPEFGDLQILPQDILEAYGVKPGFIQIETLEKMVMVE